MRDNISDIQVVHLGSLTLAGATPNASPWVDLLGYDSATIEIMTETVTDAGTAAGFTGTVQEADDTLAASATDILPVSSVDQTTVATTVTADTADNIIAGAIGYIGNKRYIRVNFVGSTGTNANVIVIARVANAARLPVVHIGASVAAT